MTSTTTRRPSPPKPAPPAPTTPRTRVLVPYLRGRGGGIHTVLVFGLAHLATDPTIALEYAELGRDQADMDELARHGVGVARTVGVAGRGILSTRSGWQRRWDLLHAAPRLAKIVWRLRAWLRTGEVVWVHGSRDLAFVSLATRLLPRAQRPVIVWHCHSLPAQRAAWLVALIKRCALVIAISHDIERRLHRLGVEPGRVRVVTNAVDSAALAQLAAQGVRAPLPHRIGRRVLLLPTAVLEANKGPHAAIAALSALPDDCDLWITGALDDPVVHAYHQELVAQIALLGLTERVHLIGHRPDIYAVMQRCDLVLVPSLWEEPFGLVAIEAMALGKPVVVSRRGALPEVLGEPPAGLIFEPERPGDLAHQVSRLLRDPALATALTQIGSARARTVFGYGRWAAEIAACLREVRA